MTRLSIAEELESAADRIADMSRADLQIILRRAALMLRNAALMLRNVAGVSLEAATADAFDSIATEMGVGTPMPVWLAGRKVHVANADSPKATE